MLDRCRLRSSSSALCALSSLTPPSPILSPSELDVSWTSGEIPIFFESPSITSFTLNASPSSDGVTFNIARSLSVETVDTMCTFGPVLKHTASQSTSQTFSSKRENTVTQIGSPGNAVFAHCDSLDSIAASALHCVSPLACLTSPSPDSRESPFPHEVENYSPWLQMAPTFRTTLNDETTYEHKESDDACEQVLRYIPPSQTFSTLPTPSFAPPSPSPSVDLALSYPCAKRRFDLATECLAHPDKNLKYDQWAMRLEEPLQCIHKPQQNNFPPSTSYSVAMPDTFSPPSCDTLVGSTLRLASSDQLDLPIRPKCTFLPENLSWLKDFAVELLIDQEGFRAIQPSFRLVGYSTYSRLWSHYLNPPSDGSTTDDGVVEFMPVKRQSFNFHYAPFDGLPTLRRITVNGNESRDYISRQASLSLKSNGVYTVRGTETSSLPAGISGNSTSHEPIKLKWKFDYMVDDRRIDSSGRNMYGEKTLTPLTFSCSPVLLHALQGKKIRLMHIMRKSVIPNLTAEKMEPPKLLLRTRPSMSNLKATIQNTTSHYLAKSQAWNRHRRARSNVVPSEDQEALVMKSPVRSPAKNLGTGVQTPSKSPEDQMKRQARRRRASSAGERSRGVPMATIGNIVPNLPRHIIPPAQLSEMLSANTEDTIQTTWRNNGGIDAFPIRTQPIHL